MTDQPVHSGMLVAALRAAQRAGNPIPGGDPQRWQRISRIARERWNTFARRHRAPADDTLAARAEDLARGLLDRCGPAPETGGPIDITDCRALARRLASVLSAPSVAGTAAAASPLRRPR